MKKIKSLFQRNYETDHLVRDEIVPGSEWVLEGAGVATRKYDGTCCLIKEGVLYKRYDAKHGKTPPDDFIPAQDPDPVTGHWPGWVRVGEGNQDTWHREGYRGKTLADGSYELCGPKIGGNKENFSDHILIKHGAIEFEDAPRDFNGLKEWFKNKDIEGIVWHHPDGRMVKIKKSDFGMERSD